MAYNNWAVVTRQVQAANGHKVDQIPVLSPPPRKTTVTTEATAGNVTYTAASLIGGFINRDPNGAGRSDVTPTAALLVAALPGAFVGQSVEFWIRNNADAAETITITAGTGCTLSGAGQSTTTITIPQNTSRLFRAVLTNVTSGSEAYVLYSMLSGTH